MSPTESQVAYDVLWITPKWPLPADDGAKQANVQLLKGCARAGLRVFFAPINLDSDLHFDASTLAAAKKTLGVAKIQVIHAENKLLGKGVFGRRIGQLLSAVTRPSLPVTYAPFASTKIQVALESLIKDSPNAIVVFDGLHAAVGAVAPGMPFAKRIVYRAHNVETAIWRRAANDAKSTLKKYFLNAQAKKVEQFERQVLVNSSLILPVSEIDKNSLVAMGAINDRTHTTPIGIDVPSTDTTHKKSASFLFVGRLDWPPNRDGLIWFLQNIWPKAKAIRPEISLSIVGSGDPTAVKRHCDIPGVTFHGRVPEVSEFYASHSASIVPVFFGSGTRVKAIESSLFSCPCIGTAVGVEGLPLENGVSYLNAETAESWIQTLVSTSDEELASIGKSAHEKVRRQYDTTVVASDVISRFNSLLN